MTPHLIQYRMNLYEPSQCLMLVIKSTNPENAPVSGRKVRKDKYCVYIFRSWIEHCTSCTTVEYAIEAFFAIFQYSEYGEDSLYTKFIAYFVFHYVGTCTVQCIVHNTVYTNSHRTITVDLRFTLHCLHTVTVTLRFIVCRHYVCDTNVYFKP